MGKKMGNPLSQLTNVVIIQIKGTFSGKVFLFALFLFTLGMTLYASGSSNVFALLVSFIFCSIGVTLMSISGALFLLRLAGEDSLYSFFAGAVASVFAALIGGLWYATEHTVQEELYWMDKYMRVVAMGGFLGAPLALLAYSVSNNIGRTSRRAGRAQRGYLDEPSAFIVLISFIILIVFLILLYSFGMRIRQTMTGLGRVIGVPDLYNVPDQGNIQAKQIAFVVLIYSSLLIIFENMYRLVKKNGAIYATDERLFFKHLMMSLNIPLAFLVIGGIFLTVIFFIACSVGGFCSQEATGFGIILAPLLQLIYFASGYAINELLIRRTLRRTGSADAK